MKNLPATAGRPGDVGQSLGWEDPLQKEMASYSYIRAWGIPWTEEPGKVWFKRSQSRTQLSD